MSRIVGERPEADTDRPIWMVTFTDLIALMVTFFVMLFAANQLQFDRWAALVDGLSRSLNPHRDASLVQPDAAENLRPVSRRRAIDLSYLELLITTKQRAIPELAGMTLRRGEDGLRLGLPTDRLFAVGEATPTPDARRAIHAMGSILGQVGNAIEVRGHTDPEPIRNGLFTSNWELSIARAVAIANELRRSGYPYPIETLGLADTRFADVPEISPASLRNAMARRVEIIVRPHRGAR